MNNQNIQTNFAEQVRPDFRIRTFYEAAKKYIYFLESWVIDKLSAPETIRLLMSLYQKAEMLPEGIDIDSLKSLLPLANAPPGHRFFRSPPGSPTEKAPFVGAFFRLTETC